MLEDVELLGRYVAEHSEDAFAEIVRRHVNLVYYAALRQTDGDAALAEDVTQTVFTDLARKAASLAHRPVLSGWLYTSTRFAALKARRTERRRISREQEAYLMHELTREDLTADWERLRPVIDDALHALDECDREAVILRFFEGRSFADVGAKLAFTEDTARKRVERALEKMHATLARHGVTSTAAALGALLANQAMASAPAGLAGSVAGAAFAAGGAASASVGTAITFMSMTKLQVGIAGALVVAGATGLVMQSREATTLKNELAELRRQNVAMAAWRTENAQLARTAADAAAVRADTAELARLREEAATLRTRLLSRAQAAQREATLNKTPPFTGRIFESAQVDQQPKSAFQIPPVVPAELRAAGMGGRALIDFVIDEQGNVRNAQVVSATHPAIGEAALEAVSLWRFEAAQKDGRAVAMHKQEPMIFTMADDKNPTTKTTTSQPDPKPRPAFVPWF